MKTSKTIFLSHLDFKLKKQFWRFKQLKKITNDIKMRQLHIFLQKEAF